MSERETHDEHTAGHATRGRLGQLTLTCLVVANMIGVGVFTTSGFALAELGTAHRVMAAWLAGGVIAFAGAVSYAALARRVLESGGEYVFLARLVHPLAGFLAGWVSLLAGFSGAIAFAALALEAYAAPWLPAWLPANAPAIGVIALAAALHGVRVETGAVAQNAIVLLKLGLLAAFVAVAAIVAAGRPDATAPPAAPPLSAGAFASTLVWVSLSYSGFNAAVDVAGEARDAAARVPRALLTGTVLVTVLYLALNAVFLYLPPHDAIVNRADVAAAAALAIGGPRLEGFVRSLVMLALVTSVFSLMMAGPRVYARMADDGVFPATYRYRGRAPRAAVALQAVLAVLLVLVAELRDLLGYLGLTLSLSAAATVGALFKNGVGRISGPVSLAACLFIAATLAAAALSAWRSPAEIAAAVVTVAIGALFYAILTRRKSRSA